LVEKWVRYSHYPPHEFNQPRTGTRADEIAVEGLDEVSAHRGRIHRGLPLNAPGNRMLIVGNVRSEDLQQYRFAPYSCSVELSIERPEGTMAQKNKTSPSTTKAANPTRASAASSNKRAVATDAAECLGADVNTIVTERMVAIAKKQLGSVPQFWGRYFKDPGD